MRVCLVVATLLLPACGDSSSPMAPIDAGGTDSLCSLPPGQAWIYTTVHVLPQSDGFDLDDDGSIDNSLGGIPTGALDSANAGLDTAIASGELLMVMYVTGWSDPPTLDDPDVSYNAFQVYDADMPADSGNNLTGSGEFVVPAGAFDLSCNSAHEADSTTLAGGVLTAVNDVWRFTLTTGLGALEFEDATLITTFAEDWSTVTSRMGSIVSLCTLSALAFPGDTPGTVLEALVNDPTLRDAVQLDVDVDGDGFEQVIGDGVSIMACVDGDGTMIMGSDCPCHPSIVDAYSSAMEFRGVRAQIVGTL